MNLPNSFRRSKPKAQQEEAVATKPLAARLFDSMFKSGMKALFSRGGPVLKAGIAAAVSLLATWLLKLGVELDGESTAMLNGVLMTLTWWIIDQLIAIYEGPFKEAIQEMAGTEKDNWIGPKTVEALKEQINTTH